MSDRNEFDPELDDALQGDRELMRIARMLGSAKHPEPPLDDAFKASLRRRLMDQAWDSVEDRRAWWRGWFAPQRLAWGSAAAVLLIAASVVLYTSSQNIGGTTETVIKPTVAIAPSGVSTQQAIPLKFNVPMDHPSTEAAVTITPATSVAFSWSGDQLLTVTPTSGNLAPNTQYQVTVGPGAKAKNGTPNKQPETFTFVTTDTNPTPSPSPSPTPSPSQNGLLTNVQQLTTDYPPSGTVYPVVWSSDSTTVYFAGAAGALESVTVADGTKKTLVPDGASLPAISQSTNQVAYVRGGKIEILDLTAGTTTKVSVDVAPTALAWSQDRLYWAGSSGVFRLGDNGPVRLADLPSSDATVISIAPDGKHAIAQVADGLFLIDIAANKSAGLCGGGCATTFQGWSPDGHHLVVDTRIYNTNGKAVSNIQPGDMSWSKTNEILLGSDTALFEELPYGSNYQQLANGTYRNPVWAPDSQTFVYVRGNALFVATAPTPAPAPTAIQQALGVVKGFMDARLAGDSGHAQGFLDANGQAAYAGTSGGPVLIPKGDPGLTRYYALLSQINPADNSARVVVRLVFAHGNVEQQAVDETLTLVRDEAVDPFLIDKATDGPVLHFGRGPQVVSVKVTPTTVSVTFDSDLLPTSIGSVRVEDDQGVVLQPTSGYDDRTVTLTGLQLTPGASYRLVVVPDIADFQHHNPATEYDLDFIGPAAEPAAGGTGSAPSPVPSPSPAVTPSAQPSPSQSS